MPAAMVERMRPPIRRSSTRRRPSSPRSTPTKRSGWSCTSAISTRQAVLHRGLRSRGVRPLDGLQGSTGLHASFSDYPAAAGAVRMPRQAAAVRRPPPTSTCVMRTKPSRPFERPSRAMTRPTPITPPNWRMAWLIALPTRIDSGTTRARQRRSVTEGPFSRRRPSPAPAEARRAGSRARSRATCRAALRRARRSGCRRSTGRDGRGGRRCGRRRRPPGSR